MTISSFNVTTTGPTTTTSSLFTTTDYCRYYQLTHSLSPSSFHLFIYLLFVHAPLYSYSFLCIYQQLLYVSSEFLLLLFPLTNEQWVEVTSGESCQFSYEREESASKYRIHNSRKRLFIQTDSPLFYRLPLLTYMDYQ